MFLFVFDASQELLTNEEVHAMRKQAIEARLDDVITLDLMEQWMAMIYCQLAVKKEKTGLTLPYPQICRIGTHGDILSKDKGSKEKVLRKLSSHCDEKYYADILYDPPLIVDNTKAGEGENEDEGFKEIRKAVSEMVSKDLRLETPVAWVLFRLLLSNLGRKIVPYAEASKLANSCGIPNEHCPAVLNFYHELGVFLFYSHIRSWRDHVIIDPKWLVKHLGKLLRFGISPGVDTRRSLWGKLRDKGIARSSLYRDVWKKSKESDVEPFMLMELLEAFHLALRVPGTDSFFLPCVLKYDDELPKVSPHGTKAATLYIVFAAQGFEALRFVPPGFFTRLVTTLAEYKSGSRSRYTLDFDTVHRRRITYSCADSVNNSDIFTITELRDAFSVDVIRFAKDQSRPFSSVCHELAFALDYCCKQVRGCYESRRKKTYSYIDCKPAVEIRWDFALLCQSSECVSRRESNHYCFFTPGEVEFMHLTCKKEHALQDCPCQRYWFIEEEKGTTPALGKGNGSSSSQDSAGPERVLSEAKGSTSSQHSAAPGGNPIPSAHPSIVADELRDFNRENWKVLGRKLGLSDRVLGEVNADYQREGVGECFIHMLQHWLNMNYDTYESKPPTWSNLADAVEKAGNRTLAITIRRNHPS